MRLLIQEADQPPREIEAVVGLTIGRGPTNDCALVDDAASSSHARIVQHGGRLAIEDVGSSNGTWIEGGSRLARGVPQPLAAQLRLLIGRTSIEVLAPEPNATVPPGQVDAPTLPGAPVGPAGDPDPATVQPQAPRVSQRPASPSAVTSKPDPSKAAPSKSAPWPTAPPSPQQALARAPVPESETVGAGSGDLLTVGGTLVAEDGEMDEAAIQVRLNALKPRLVFVSHKVGRAKDLREPMAEIGRREGGPVAIGLEDEGVSSRHARITFDGHALYVEDLNSSNGTWVGETKLAARAGPREVRCDERIRIGTVDVLFVLDSIAGAGHDTTELYTNAMASLQRDPALSQEKVREAARLLKSGGHPGEYLVMENAISVVQWCDAVEAARLRRRLNEQGGGGGSKAIYWLLAIVLIAAAAFAAMKLLR